jgi:hypothetical protein
MLDVVSKGFNFIELGTIGWQELKIQVLFLPSRHFFPHACGLVEGSIIKNENSFHWARAVFEEIIHISDEQFAGRAALMRIGHQRVIALHKVLSLCIKCYRSA